MIKYVVPVVVLSFVLQSGCQKRPLVEAVHVQAQIESYIDGAELPRGLFRTDSLILSAPYQFPGVSGTFRDSVIGHTRTINFSEPVTIQYTPVDALGVLSVQAQFTDTYSVIRTKMPANTSETVSRQLKRNGWFLKVGQDSDPFYGWILWGFNGTVGVSSTNKRMPLDLRCVTEDSLIFSGDEDLLSEQKDDASNLIGNFVLVENIPNVPDGKKILLQATTSNTSIPIRYFASVSARTDFGYEQSIMTRVTTNLSRDTIETKTLNPALWNLLYVEADNDSTLNFFRSWVIPYRVPQ